MLNGTSASSTRKGSISRIALIAAVGGLTFLLGLGATVGMMQLSAQKKQLAQMNDLVTQMAAQREVAAAPVPQPVAPVANDQQVTRTAATDLLDLLSVAEPALQATAVSAPTSNLATQAMVNAALAPVAPPAIDLTALVKQAASGAAVANVGGPAGTTAQKIRSLVNAAVVVPEQDTGPSRVERAAAERFETFAVIQAGVEELVEAVVEGNYTIDTDYEDADFSGRLHFTFIGHEEDQEELERFLANAAERGIVKHSNAVVGSDGSVNGHILLYDLVERVLENGTAQEQRAGAKLRAEAKALLAPPAAVVATTPQAETFYVVEEGDSLAYIALQFYGNTNSFNRIYEANRDTIAQPDKIRVGQRLRIPSA